MGRGRHGDFLGNWLNLSRSSRWTSHFTRILGHNPAREEAAVILHSAKLLPLLGRELNRAGVDGLPDGFVRACRRAYRGNARRAGALLGRLREVLEAFHDAGIPVMVMRTPYLVELVYGGNYGLRSFVDIDLAVLPEDVDAAVEALRGRFPDMASRNRDPGVADRKAASGSRMELRVNGAPLDLHWDLTLFYNFHRSTKRAARQAGIWERSREVEYAWGRRRVMSHEDLVCHLAEHPGERLWNFAVYFSC